MFVQMRIIFPIGFSMIFFGMIQGYKNYSNYIYSASFINKLRLICDQLGYSLLIKEEREGREGVR